MTRREWLVLTGCSALAGCAKRPLSLAFTPSDEEHGNPERGFYVQRAAEDFGDAADIRGNGVTLVLLTLDLKHYRSRRLDEAKLSVLDDALHRLHRSGLKVVFRAAYGFTDADYRVDPADLSLVRGHIDALGRVLGAHAPWVFAVQAGMLGPWGEWHGSNHGNPPSLEARLAVVRAWSETLPERIFLQIRRPMFLRDMNPDLKRVGFHNDALLAMPDDMGTYSEPGWDRSRELDWCSAKLAAVPFGGETVPASEPTPPRQVLDELARLHTTYLNQGYHEGTLDRWKQTRIGDSSLWETVHRKLGYRLVPTRLRIDGEKGELALKNEGFSAPLHSRALSFAWIDPDSRKTTREIAIPHVDCRDWHPRRGEIKIPFQAPPPASPRMIPAIRLADVSPQLADDGRHAIRLIARGSEFDSASGWNLMFPGT